MFGTGEVSQSCITVGKFHQSIVCQTTLLQSGFKGFFIRIADYEYQIADTSSFEGNLAVFLGLNVAEFYHPWSHQDFASTIEYVEDFQRSRRLSVDGVAGVQTQLVLDAALGAPGTPTLAELGTETGA